MHRFGKGTNDCAPYAAALADWARVERFRNRSKRIRVANNLIIFFRIAVRYVTGKDHE